MAAVSSWFSKSRCRSWAESWWRRRRSFSSSRPLAFQLRVVVGVSQSLQGVGGGSTAQVEYISLALVFHSPAPVVEFFSPAPAVFQAPPPVIENISPGGSIASASCGVCCTRASSVPIASACVWHISPAPAVFLGALKLVLFHDSAQQRFLEQNITL